MDERSLQELSSLMQDASSTLSQSSTAAAEATGTRCIRNTQPLVVVASWVSTLSNVAGLLRTCETFGAERITVASAHVCGRPLRQLRRCGNLLRLGTTRC